MRTYTAVITREGDAWLAEVPEVEGTRTFARNLLQLRKHVVEAIEVGTGEDVEEGQVAYDTTRLDPTMRRAFELGHARSQAEAMIADVQAESARLARELSEEGYSLRDTAGALGLTYGRVHQLLKAS